MKQITALLLVLNIGFFGASALFIDTYDPAIIIAKSKIFLGSVTFATILLIIDIFKKPA